MERVLGAMLLLTVLILPLAGCGDRPPVERVVLIGVDGLDWRVLQPLIDEGAVPNLARFVERGAAGQVDTLLPAFSPNIWASVVTGKLPGKHGITGFTRREPDGTEVPFTSNSRHAEALWEILSRAGRRVGVIGWWTTWPAEAVNGVMVSDRMLYNRFNLLYGYARYGADLPAQTWPPELFDELVDMARIPEDFEQEFFARFGPGRPVAWEQDLHDPWYELLLVHARDEAYRKILERVAERERFDFIAWYVNGADIASHYFWKYEFPDEWSEPLDEPELGERREVIRRYYAWIDEAIGPLLGQASASCLVVVLSDHGFVTGRRGDSPNISGVHYNVAPPGVILAAGGAVTAGARLDRMSVLDVTPTLLQAMGLPVARDMNGMVSHEIAPGAVQWVATYETDDSEEDTVPIATEHDEAILEKLRALGYIGE